MNNTFLALLISTLFSCALIAQNSISGRVLDIENNQPLIGANVIISTTQTGATTDFEGYFSFESPNQKSVDLSISYTGYETKNITVTPPTENLIIKLAISIEGLNEVLVTGIAEGQIKAFIEMKKAESIKNIISSEQILTFPDLSAAEVLKRIPGITLQSDQGEGRFVQLRGTPPELTNFNVNGEQIPSPEGGFRYVGMDIIPSDQIESVEVTKVMTPDMDGDGIGGSVNIKTKEASGEKPEINATIASGYNNLRQQPLYNLQFSYGQRYNKLGFQVNASHFESNQGAHNIEYKFAKGPFFNTTSQQAGRDNFFLQYREAQLRHYEITRTRTSVSPTLDYKFSDESFIYLRGMYNQFKDDEVRRRLIYDLEDALNANYYLFGGVEHDVKDRTKNQELSTISLGGEHKLGKIKVDYQLFYALANEKAPDRFEAVFENSGQAIDISFDVTDPEYPRATFPVESNAVNATAFERFEMDEMIIESSETKEILLTPRINVTIPYDFANGQNGYFKFGGKIRSREKTQDIRSQVFGAYRQESRIYPGLGGELNLLTASDDFHETNLLNQNYELQAMPSADVMLDFYEFYPQYFIFDRNETRKNSYNEDYTYKEDIYAAYGMFRHNIGDLMILGGLRFERTDVSQNEGFGIILDRGRFLGIDTTNTTRVQEFFLPQLQLKYSVTPNLNIRTALTYTYARPNYSDVIPSREEDRNEVAIGNPDLNFPRSTNLDVLIEKYYNRGILSGGFFYKQIEDFVFSYKRFGREGDPSQGSFPLFEFTKPLNGKNARVFGAEFQAQFKFDFLNGFFSDFGLFTNYTYTNSEAFLPKRAAANYANAIILNPLADDLSAFFTEDGSEKISLPGQAEHTANVGLFYDGKQFFARLTANYQDAFLVEIGPDPDLDEYYDESLRLDFTMNLQIGRNVNIFNDWINITNTPLRFYLGTPDVIKQQEFYSWWTRFGMRISL